jgi:hypothetical protein
MLSFVRGNDRLRLIVEEGPQFVGAMVIAETAYRFHSFSLECIAFLATWWLLSAGRCWIENRAHR